MGLSRYLSKLAPLVGSDGKVLATGLSSGAPVWDGSGNLLINTASVSNTPGWDKLVQIYATNYPALSLKNSFRQWDITNYGSAGALIFYDATAAAERARIDTGGSWIIGASSARASSKLDIRGDVMTLGSNASYFATIDYNAGTGLLSLASESGGGVVLKSGSTERARMDTSGRWLVNTNYTPSGYPAKGTSVSGGVLYSHECSFGGSTKVVTFSGDFNYFCELTVTVWTNASAGIYQGKFIAGRRDWTGANHQTNYADQIGTALDYSLSTSDSGNTRTFTVTFSCSTDSANLHWSIETKCRNILSYSVS